MFVLKNGHAPQLSGAECQDPTIPKSRCYTTLWFIYIVNHRTRFRLLLFSDINISQGSVVTHLRGDGIFYCRITTNLLLSLPVK